MFVWLDLGSDRTILNFVISLSNVVEGLFRKIGNELIIKEQFAKVFNNIGINVGRVVFRLR